MLLTEVANIISAQATAMNEYLGGRLWRLRRRIQRVKINMRTENPYEMKLKLVLNYEKWNSDTKHARNVHTIEHSLHGGRYESRLCEQHISRSNERRRNRTHWKLL